MKKTIGILLAFLLFAAAPAAAAGDIVRSVLVGNAEIALPVLEGFKEVFGASPQFDAFARQIVPPENRLLGVYLLPGDAAAVAAGRQTEMKRYIVVQTPRSDVTIGTADEFAAIKKQALAEAGETGDSPGVKQQIDRISDYVSKSSGQDTQLAMGETRSLGAFLDEDNALGVSMLANIGVQVAGQGRDIPVAISLMALNVKGKVLYAMVYAMYSGARDEAFARAAGGEFVRKAFIVNGGGGPQGAARKAAEEYDAADDRLSFAMIATGVISVLVLAFFVFAPLIRRLRGGRDETL